MSRGLAGILWALTLASCTAPPTISSAEPLVGWFQGCDRVGDDCAVPPDEPVVTVWVETQNALVVRLGGQAVSTSPTPIDGGQRIVVDVPTAPAALSITDAETGARWSLSLVAKVEEPDGDPAWCEQANDVVADGEQARIEAFCAWQAFLRAPNPEAQDAAALALPKRLEHAADGFAKATRWTDASATLNQAAFSAYDHGDSDRARAIMERVEYGESGAERWLFHYMNGLIYLRDADYDDADDELKAAETWIGRVGLPTMAVDSTASARANLSGEMGDLDGAVAAHRQIVANHPLAGECDGLGRVESENLAWFELLRRRSGATPAGDLDPTAILAEVVAAHERCDSDPADRASVVVSQAFDSWSREDWAGVLTTVGPGAQLPTAEMWVWAHALRASALFELGRMSEAAEAVAKADSQPSLSTVNADVFTHLVAADIHLASGRAHLAEERLLSAQDLVFDSLPRLPSNTDRSAFVGLRYRVTPRLVSLLAQIQLHDGRPDEAMRSVRLSRVRALRSLRRTAHLSQLDLDERERWSRAKAAYEDSLRKMADATADRWTLSLSDLAEADRAAAALQAQADRSLGDALQLLGSAESDALRSPASGERIVVWIAADDRWIALVQSKAGVQARPGPPLSVTGRPLADALIAGIAQDLADTTRLTILPWGAVHDLDLHMANFQGLPLLESMQVVWSLDLAPGPPANVRALTLVVGDPAGNLPYARAEATQAAKTLQAELLLGPAATFDAVRGRLPQVDRLHFAGHGSLDSGQVWRSGLTLADGTLDVADILALERSPRLVVLSGCETGRSSTETRVASLGIAQALLMSGAEAVVASSRPVDDEQTSVRMGELLEDVQDRDGLISALHHRQRTNDSLDKAGAWRVWIP